ncbi:uncharacterized protein LOC142348443 isoform X3 [Convolutriloba macropyga]|uniref:uncharacterized protein LOC142348443 isoform X3 n=1 Tax=Convolutriloba macropyga TaxID=536237 RepID=UPI003F51D523
MFLVPVKNQIALLHFSEIQFFKQCVATELATEMAYYDDGDFLGALLGATGTSFKETLNWTVEQEAAGAEPDIDSGEGFFLNEDALDPSSNFDYTHMKDDGTKYSRGGYPYIKPFGWFRLGLNVQDRQLFGKGIYSTPYPFIAEKFATEFIYAGKTFKLLMQNRVDMSRTTLENDNMYYVTQDDRYIRPYGLLFKEVFEEMY